MNAEKVNIVLVEDNPYDVELTLHALEKYKLANSVKVLNDVRRRSIFFLLSVFKGEVGLLRF